jgi:hypothetical protein
MCLEQKACHNLKIPASTAKSPKQIGMQALAGCDKTAIGQDNIRQEQVINREAVLACEVPGSSAEGETCDTGGRDKSEGHG